MNHVMKSLFLCFMRLVLWFIPPILLIFVQNKGWIDDHISHIHDYETGCVSNN